MYKRQVYALLFTITFGFLVWQLNSGMITVGSFIVFIALFYSLRGDLNQLAENLKVYNELGGYIEQIDAVLTVRLHPARNAKTDDPNLAVSYTHLSVLAYPPIQYPSRYILQTYVPQWYSASVDQHFVENTVLPRSVGSVPKERPA